MRHLLTIKRQQIAAAVLVGSIAILAAPAPVYAQTAERAPEAIECPQTMISPDAQKRIDAGEKPVVKKSWYKPGLVNQRGFCTITVAHNGKTIVQRYNEATSVQNIPVRAVYGEYSLDFYAGEKGLPFGVGSTDMVCWAPRNGEMATECRIALTSNGAMHFTYKEGRAVEEKASASINSEAMFGVKLSEMSKFAHFESIFDPTAVTPTSHYQKADADCSKPMWQNLANMVHVKPGTANGSNVVPVKTFTMQAQANSVMSPDSQAPYIAKLTVEGGDARSIMQSVMSNQAVQIDVSTECEGTLSKAYTTELPRLMGFIYEQIKRPMMAQQR